MSRPIPSHTQTHTSTPKLPGEHNARTENDLLAQDTVMYTACDAWNKNSRHAYSGKHH